MANLKSLNSIQQEIDSRVKERDELIETIENAIRVLNRRGYKIFEKDNEEYFLSGNISWSSELNGYVFETDKEE